MPLNPSFWSDELTVVLEAIILTWTEAAWDGALAVMEVLNAAGLPAVDEAEVWSEILDWIAINGPLEAALILENTRESVEKALDQWDGESEDELLLLLAPIFSEVRAETIGLNEVIIGYTIGNLFAWRAYGVIEQVIWMTQEDEKVCPICKPLHEEIISIDEALFGTMRPPAHPRCRCWLEAILVLAMAPLVRNALMENRISMERLEEVAYVIEG